MSSEYYRRGRNWFSAIGVMFCVMAGIVLVRQLVIWGPEFVEEFYNGAGKPTVEVFDDPAKFYSANQTVRADKNWKETYLEGNFSDKCWIEGGKKKWTVTENNEIDFEIRIYQAQQARINKVVVNGNVKTNDHVIMREPP